MMMDKRKPIPSMVRKAIFQEANSRCALCKNSDIAALDIHHIDAIKDAGTNSPENLIVLCANCHRKVTHGSVSRDELAAAKNGLQSARATDTRNDHQVGNVVHIQGNVEGSIVANTVRLATKRLPRPKYPNGCVGADLPKRNYISYLVNRYYEFRRADTSFGANARLQSFSYAVLHKNIEREFKAKTFYVPVHRFAELVSYLQGCVDRTIQGKTNRARGTPNYENYEDYVNSQQFAPVHQ
jgi:hypothetical protein